VLAALSADASARPIRASLALAWLFDAKVDALHVRENGASTAREVAGAAGVELHETSGSPIEEIVKAARSPEVVAVVVGASSLPGGPRPAGRTTTQVITRVTKPVVVVAPSSKLPERPARMLVALEDTSECSRALDATIALATTRGIEVLVLHSLSLETVPPFADHAPHAQQAWEHEFLSRYVPGQRGAVTLLSRIGVAAEDVASIATETGADLIALAWGRRLGIGRASVVSQTIARASVPVMLLARDPNSARGEGVTPRA
jgi:nucleotide-binding universal stress UspA family protein